MFAFVSDHENLPAWTAGVKQSRRLTDGPPAAGARYRVVGRLLGRPVDSNYQVTAFEPGRGFDGTMTSPMFGFREQYRFEHDQGGTRVPMSSPRSTLASGGPGDPPVTVPPAQQGRPGPCRYPSA